MEWARLLAYITGTVDQELLLRNEYLAAENRILNAQIKGRLLLTDVEKPTLAEIGYRLGRKALEDVAHAARPDTILGWYRKLVARMFDGSKSRRYPGSPRIDCDDESFFAATLSQNGYVPILQVLREVNLVCDFIRCFKHLSPMHHKMKPTEEMLMAGILGKGCNIGIGKLAAISASIREHTLNNAVTWYFDIKNIRSANQKIVDVIHRLALPNNYLNEASVIHSSSDGRKVNVAVDCLHASYSYKYFGKDKGVTDDTQ